MFEFLTWEQSKWCIFRVTGKLTHCSKWRVICMKTYHLLLILQCDYFTQIQNREHFWWLARSLLDLFNSSTKYINYPSKAVPLDESFLWWQPLIFRQSVKLNVYNHGMKLHRSTELSSMILIIYDCTEQLGNQGANGHAVNLWMQFVDVNLNVV